MLCADMLTKQLNFAFQLSSQPEQRSFNSVEVRHRTATRTHDQPQVLGKLTSVLAKGFANKSLPTIALRRVANFFRNAQSKLGTSLWATNGVDNQHTIGCYLATLKHGSKIRLTLESRSGWETR